MAQRSLLSEAAHAFKAMELTRRLTNFLRVFVAVLKTIAVAGLNLLKLRRTKITPT